MRVQTVMGLGGRERTGTMEQIADLLERLQDKAAAMRGQGTHSRLLPDRHPVRDFFLADIVDWAVKDDRHSMEHPMFALSKKPDRQIRRYEHNGISVTITPSVLGLATIWDKDVLIYAVSQLVTAMNHNRPVNRTLRLKAYDFLVATNRHTGGDHYKRLEAAFERLSGTRIKTNIATNGQRVREGFGLIDNWKIIEKSPIDNRMVAVEITLNDWLFNAIVAREILTLNRDYFRLDGGLERRLYELARKHCGNQSHWAVSLELLHKKTGSTASLKEFRRKVKILASRPALLDYQPSYDIENDQIMFCAKPLKKLPESSLND
jgi:plasmid replication initiation protein